jgi:hypothetical protein
MYLPRLKHDDVSHKEQEEEADLKLPLHRVHDAIPERKHVQRHK